MSLASKVAQLNNSQNVDKNKKEKNCTFDMELFDKYTTRVKDTTASDSPNDEKTAQTIQRLKRNFSSEVFVPKAVPFRFRR